MTNLAAVLGSTTATPTSSSLLGSLSSEVLIVGMVALVVIIVTVFLTRPRG